MSILLFQHSHILDELRIVSGGMYNIFSLDGFTSLAKHCLLHSGVAGFLSLVLGLPKMYYCHVFIYRFGRWGIWGVLLHSIKRERLSTDGMAFRALYCIIAWHQCRMLAESKFMVFDTGLYWSCPYCECVEHLPLEYAIVNSTEFFDKVFLYYLVIVYLQTADGVWVYKGIVLSCQDL